MKYIILILLLFSACSSHSDKGTADSLTEFERFAELFEIPSTPIPDSLLVKYFHEDTVDMVHRVYLSIGQIQFSDQIIGLTYRMKCQAGGLCGASYLATFYNEKYSDKIEIAHEYADAGFSNTLDYKVSGDIIELRSKTSDYQEDDDDNIILNQHTDSTFIYKVDVTSGKIDRR